jgi:hypothetical protein
MMSIGILGCPYEKEGPVFKRGNIAARSAHKLVDAHHSLKKQVEE